MSPAGGWIDPMGNYGKHSRQWLGHSWRYYMASGFLEPNDLVRDFGCGMGYGTKILSQKCEKVSGYDVDVNALELARKKFSFGFWFTDFDEVDALPPCDVAVSFETLEHLNDPPHFAQMLKWCASRLIIISTPIIPTVGINPHHQHDFTEESFMSLFLDDVWTLWEFVKQGPYGVMVAYRKEE